MHMGIVKCMEAAFHIHIYIYITAYRDTHVHTNNTCYIDDTLYRFTMQLIDTSLDVYIGGYREASMDMGMMQQMEATFHMNM
jgi:hypothetical protein